jgi:hypothetical protein
MRTDEHGEVRKSKVAVIERNCIEGGEDKIAPYTLVTNMPNSKKKI